MGPASTASAAPFALSTIGQIGVTVTQIDRAIAFYRDALGIPFLFQAPNLGFFDCAGVRLMLTAAEGPAEPLNSPIYFRVPDIQRAFEGLAARGVPFERDPHRVARLSDREVWMAFFRDPDRNLLAIMSEVPRD